MFLSNCPSTVRVIAVFRKKTFYVPAGYIMYLSDFCRFLLCTCGWERKGERGAGEGGWIERG
jgi:hypothetical protein